MGRVQHGVDWDENFCNAFMCHHVSALMLFTIFPLAFIVGLATFVGHPHQVFSTGQEFGGFVCFLFFLCRENFTYTSGSMHKMLFLGSAFVHVSIFLFFSFSFQPCQGQLGGGLLLKDERKMG
jgi:hypothetical protein